MKYARRDARIYTDLEPIDMNDPESTATAIEYGLPESFSGKAKACWQYFSGAAYLFETGHREGPSIPGTRSKPFWSRFLMNFWKTT